MMCKALKLKTVHSFETLLSFQYKLSKPQKIFDPVNAPAPSPK